MEAPRSSSAYASLRSIIDIAAFVSLAISVIGFASILFGGMRGFGFFILMPLAYNVLAILGTLVLRGLAQAFLDIADAHKRRE